MAHCRTRPAFDAFWPASAHIPGHQQFHAQLQVAFCFSSMSWSYSIFISSVKEYNMIKNGMRPIHPGEILREDFLAPLKMTPHALAARSAG